MRGGAAEKRLRVLLSEHARVEGAVVQLAEREERGERDAAVAAAERAVRQQREEERGDFLRKRRIRLAAECRDLRPLHGVDEAELRVDDAGMRLRAAELRGDGAVQLDDVPHRQVADTAVSRWAYGRALAPPVWALTLLFSAGALAALFWTLGPALLLLATAFLPAGPWSLPEALALADFAFALSPCFISNPRRTS